MAYFGGQIFLGGGALCESFLILETPREGPDSNSTDNEGDVLHTSPSPVIAWVEWEGGPLHIMCRAGVYSCLVRTPKKQHSFAVEVSALRPKSHVCSPNMLRLLAQTR